VTDFDSSAVRRVTGWLVLAVLGWGVFRIVRPFLVPLAWAAVLAVFFYPLAKSIRRKLGRPNLACLLTVVFITLLLVLPVAGLAPALISQSVSILGSLREGELLAHARAFLEQYWARSPVPLGDIQNLMDELAQRAAALAAQYSARLAGNLVGLAFDLAVMLLALFYMLRDGERVALLVRDISPWGLERHDLMIKEAVELVQVTITSSFITAAVQGALGGLIFWALGISSPLFWGALMALLALLPILGPWLVWGPAAVVMLFSGQIGRGVALIVLGLVIVSGVDNVLRPALIAGRSQLNGLLVLISVLGGISAMGFLGVVLGPVLVATGVGLLRGYHESLERKRQAETAGGAQIG